MIALDYPIDYMELERVKRDHPCNECGKILVKGTERIVIHWNSQFDKTGRYCKPCARKLGIWSLKELEKELFSVGIKSKR